MAKKKETDESLAVSAAKVIGEVAGKIATLAGAGGEKTAPAKKKVEKLAPKNKQRLPRKQKKAQKKQANKSQGH